MPFTHFIRVLSFVPLSASATPTLSGHQEDAASEALPLHPLPTFVLPLPTLSTWAGWPPCAAARECAADGQATPALSGPDAGTTTG